MFKRIRRSQSEVRTLIGSGTRVVGDVDFVGGMHLDGRVEGNVRGDGPGAVLTIGAHGVVDGSVEVPAVLLEGTIHGDVVAAQRVELASTSRVVGNVFYDVIEMADGAEVDGRLVHLEHGPGTAEDPASGPV